MPRLVDNGLGSSYSTAYGEPSAFCLFIIRRATSKGACITIQGLGRVRMGWRYLRRPRLTLHLSDYCIRMRQRCRLSSMQRFALTERVFTYILRTTRKTPRKSRPPQPECYGAQLASKDYGPTRRNLTNWWL